MSHELRTPLTAITAVTEVLEEELDAGTGGLDPMIEPAVRLVVSETRRLNDLVENPMEVTRFDAGTARLVLDYVDIADQITACIDARAWLDAVELNAERGIMARLDPRRLDVILANLIGNALKHGGSPVRVAVREEGEELVIEVRDHGPGIPEDVLPHVFDRFYKASASRPRSEARQRPRAVHRDGERAHPRRRDHGRQLPEGGAVFTLRLPRDASPLVEEEKRNGNGQRGTRDERTWRAPLARRSAAGRAAGRLRHPLHPGADGLRPRALPDAVRPCPARICPPRRVTAFRSRSSCCAPRSW